MKKSRCTSQMADNGIFTFFSFPKIFETGKFSIEVQKFEGFQAL